MLNTNIQLNLSLIFIVSIEINPKGFLQLFYVLNLSLNFTCSLELSKRGNLSINIEKSSSDKF